MRACPKNHPVREYLKKGLERYKRFSLDDERNDYIEEDIVWVVWCEHCNDYYFERDLLEYKFAQKEKSFMDKLYCVIEKLRNATEDFWSDNDQ